LAAAQGSAAPATTTSFEEDPNLLAIFNLMRSAPPRLPMEAEGGRFAVDTDGNVLVVLKARDGESFIKEKPEKEDPRWLKVTGFQGLLGYSAAGRKVKALFDTLLRSVRFLDRFGRSRPLDSRDVDKVSAVRDSLWVRLPWWQGQA
jgi:hypothetical protein